MQKQKDFPKREERREFKRDEPRYKKDQTAPPPWRREGPPRYTLLTTSLEYFHCGKNGHMKRDCRVKMEDAKCSMTTTKTPPEWMKTLKVNGCNVTALLDTGCTKSLVHPKCVEEADYLGWSIPYNTASNKRTCFPAARVTMELEGKKRPYFWGKGIFEARAISSPGKELNNSTLCSERKSIENDTPLTYLRTFWYGENLTYDPSES